MKEASTTNQPRAEKYKHCLGMFWTGGSFVQGLESWSTRSLRRLLSGSLYLELSSSWPRGMEISSQTMFRNNAHPCNCFESSQPELCRLLPTCTSCPLATWSCLDAHFVDCSVELSFEVLQECVHCVVSLSLHFYLCFIESHSVFRFTTLIHLFPSSSSTHLSASPQPNYSQRSLHLQVLPSSRKKLPLVSLSLFRIRPVLDHCQHSLYTALPRQPFDAWST